MYILFLVLLNAFFVMAEYSLARIRKGQLLEMKEKGISGADKLLGIFEKRNHYISAAQVGITCTSLLLGWYGGPRLAKWLTERSWLQEWIRGAGELSLSVAGLPVETEVSALNIICAFLTFPFVSIAFFLAKTIALLFGIRYSPREDISRSEEELRQIVSASEKEGELDSAERTMIDNVFEFNDIVAREVMVPRQDMVCIYLEDSMEEIRELIRTDHHTRFPVCDEDKDHVLGILHVRDLFNATLTPDFDIRSLVRKTIMVPEGMDALRVLQTMQKQRVHLAVVVDEFGGTAGLVTLEDLLEEIVGDIQDESDEPEAPEVLPLPDGSYDLDGEMTLDDVSELLSLTFETGFDEDTLGGYIFGRLGRKPEEGDEICRKNWRFTVLKMDQFRIERVKAEKMKKRADI